MQMQNTDAPALAGDLIERAEGIAEFIYGDRRKYQAVYHLIRKGAIPTFRMGGKVCARKSVLMGWIAEQERASTSAT